MSACDIANEGGEAAANTEESGQSVSPAAEIERSQDGDPHHPTGNTTPIPGSAAEHPAQRVEETQPDITSQFKDIQADVKKTRDESEQDYESLKDYMAGIFQQLSSRMDCLEAEVKTVTGQVLQVLQGDTDRPGAAVSPPGEADAAAMDVRREQENQDSLAAQKEEVLQWMEALMKEKITRDQPFEKTLKDGALICKLINVLQPGSVKRIQTRGSNFQLMENIAAYQKAVKKYGQPEEEIFQTADLFEARNIKQVVLSLYSLARTAQNKGFDGPTLGPKMADANKREFTEEQLREAKNTVSLQYGSNKGASAAGISMGKPRSIVD